VTFEKGGAVAPRTVKDLQLALERAGVIFLPEDEGGLGIGVRLNGPVKASDLAD
jgi:hypothetical protein